METIYPLDKIYSNATGVTYPVCGAGHGSGPTPDPKSQYFCIENLSGTDNLVDFRLINGHPRPQIEYSLDGENWQSFSTFVKLEDGEKMYLRGTSFHEAGNTGYVQLNISGDFNASGNIMSMVDYTNMTTLTSIGEREFRNLFDGSNIVSAENMNFGNVETVDSYSIMNMFRNSTKLTKGPDFSTIKTLNGSSAFSTVFKGCSNLETVYVPKVESWDSGKFDNWLQDAGTNVTGTKTAYVPTGVTIPESNSGVPSGWTRTDY